MKRCFLMVLGGALLMAVASCGGGKSSESGENKSADVDFAASQPVESGEYRAVSFQYADTVGGRMPFDGRIIFALDPDSSGIYIYENGNRTRFGASMVLKEAFAKSDSIYQAVDTKDRKVEIIPGAEVDTLQIVKDDRPVKVAFERKAISTMPARDAWTRITERLKK